MIHLTWDQEECPNCGAYFGSPEDDDDTDEGRTCFCDGPTEFDALNPELELLRAQAVLAGDPIETLRILGLLRFMRNQKGRKGKTP